MERIWYESLGVRTYAEAWWDKPTRTLRVEIAKPGDLAVTFGTFTTREEAIREVIMLIDLAIKDMESINAR